MNFNILSVNQIKKLIKIEVDKRESQMQRLLDLLHARLRKIEEEIKVNKIKKQNG